jgi:hypothetical protein
VSCALRRDLMPEFLLGALAPEEMRDIESHLATGCLACAASRAEAETVLALIPSALDPVSPRPQTRARVLDRVRASPRADSPRADPARPAAPERAQSPIPGPGRWTPARWAAALALGAVGGAICGQALLNGRIHTLERVAEEQRRDNLQLRHDNAALGKTLSDESADAAVERSKRMQAEDRLAALTKDAAAIRSEAERAIRDAHDTVAMLRSQSTRVVALKAMAVAPEAAVVRALYDTSSHHWQLFTSGLKPMADQGVYELWFIPATAGAHPIPGGTFTVDAQGDGILTTVVPAAMAGGGMAAITAEPAPMPAPTGAIALAARL